jgi:hypothetical protein
VRQRGRQDTSKGILKIKRGEIDRKRQIKVKEGGKIQKR